MSNLPEKLNRRLAELLNDMECEQNRPVNPSMISFGMRLRSLSALCPAPGTDPTGQVRMSQAQEILRALERDKTMPANLRQEICVWLEDYAFAVF